MVFAVLYTFYRRALFSYLFDLQKIQGCRVDKQQITSFQLSKPFTVHPKKVPGYVTGQQD